MFSIFTHVMKPVRDTNNEPGLPVGHVSHYHELMSRVFPVGR